MDETHLGRETAPALVADVGGTNVRFALADQGPDGPVLKALVSWPAAQFDTLEAALGHYLDTVAPLRPAAAALAVAGPVAGEEIRLTNRDWAFRIPVLQEHFGWRRLAVLNDFAAIGWAVTRLARSDRRCLRAPGVETADAPVSVIGPGTGLGVALLAGSERRGWQVIPTEGGHSDFVPRDADEQRVADWIGARLGRVSNEHLLSGPGLPRIAAALAGAAELQHTPAGLLQGALTGADPLATRTIALFLRALGRLAGQVAMLHGAGRVVLAGGILPRLAARLADSPLGPAFSGATPDLQRHLAGVALELIVHPQPGLLGAAVALAATRP